VAASPSVRWRRSRRDRGGYDRLGRSVSTPTLPRPSVAVAVRCLLRPPLNSMIPAPWPSRDREWMRRPTGRASAAVAEPRASRSAGYRLALPAFRMLRARACSRPARRPVEHRTSDLRPARAAARSPAPSIGPARILVPPSPPARAPSGNGRREGTKISRTEDLVWRRCAHLVEVDSEKGPPKGPLRLPYFRATCFMCRLPFVAL